MRLQVLRVLFLDFFLLYRLLPVKIEFIVFKPPLDYLNLIRPGTLREPEVLPIYRQLCVTQQRKVVLIKFLLPLIHLLWFGYAGGPLLPLGGCLHYFAMEWPPAMQAPYAPRHN